MGYQADEEADWFAKVVEVSEGSTMATKTSEGSPVVERRTGVVEGK